MTRWSTMLLSPFVFVIVSAKAILGFFWLWLKSRRFLRIVGSFPAVILASAFFWAMLKATFWTSKSERLERYLSEAREAVANADLGAARLLFRRAEQVAPDDLDLKFELATSLFQSGERSEAFQMLLTLAPARRTGYLPAHRFLSEHPPDGPKTNQDAFRAIHLSHLAKASAATRAERTALLQLLAKYRRFSDAEALIQASLSESPEDRLLLAQLKAANGDNDAARKEAELACDELSRRLQSDPDQHRLRLPLAQGRAMLGNFAEAIGTLCEGLRSDSASDSFDDALPMAVARTHLAWISTLPIDSQAIQRKCLARMMTGSSSDKSSQLFSADFEANLTQYLKSAEGRWMITAIHGNAMAASGDLVAAASLLREAHEVNPNDPVVANNLSWVILQLTQSGNSRDDNALRLEEALRLCTLATDQMPDIASFIETRAQVNLAMNRPAEALQDFKRCRDLGMSTESVEDTIRKLEKQLSE